MAEKDSIREVRSLAAPGAENRREGGLFLSDVTELRRRARQHIENGAVTDRYKADRETVDQGPERGARDRDRLRAALQAPLLHGDGHPRRTPSRPSSWSTPPKSRQHADQIAERITQLGGEPNFNPDGLLSRSHSAVRRGRHARRHDQGGPRRRAHRHRVLLGDHPLPRRRGHHVAPHDGADPRRKKSTPTT